MHPLVLEYTQSIRGCSMRGSQWRVFCLAHLFLVGGCATPPPAAIRTVAPTYPWCTDLDCTRYSWTDYRTTATRIRQLYETGRFDLLERALEEFALQATTFPDGRSRMSAAYQGFREAISSRQLDPGVAGRNARWRAAIPDSSFVTFAEARFEYATAWMARGRCEAECVASDAWQQYTAHLMRAEQILESASQRLKDTMLWHHLLLAIAQDSASTRNPPNTVFEAAVKLWPDEYSFYDLRLTRLTPQWGGNWAEVESFIERWTQTTAARDGRSLYARLYLDLAEAGEPFDSTNAEWPKMRVAFRDLVTRFPDNRYANLYASYACSASDAAAYSEAIELLGIRALEEDLWLPSTSKTLCEQRLHIQ
jgi:hypothetical protein